MAISIVATMANHDKSLLLYIIRGGAESFCAKFVILANGCCCGVVLCLHLQVSEPVGETIRCTANWAVSHLALSTDKVAT